MKLKLNPKINISQIAEYICIISVVLSLLFYQYSTIIPGVTLSELMLIISCLIIIIKRNFHISMKNTKVLFLYYGIAVLFFIISTIISGVHFSVESEFEVITRLIRSFAYVIFIIIYSDNIGYKEGFYKLYRIFCYVAALYAIIQFIVYVFAGVVIPVKVLPFPIRRDVSTDALLNSFSKTTYRGMGFFVEPSYLTKFLLPGFVFSVLGWGKDKRDYFCAVLISISLIISTSLQGIVIWGITIIGILIIKKKITTKDIGRVVGIVLAILAILLVSYKLGLLGRVFNRLSGFESNNIDSSSQIRLLRGFAYWWKLPILMKIIGVGTGNSANYAYTFGIRTAFDYKHSTSIANLSYMSAFSKILVESGIPCLVIFVYLFVRFFKITNNTGKLLCVQYLLTMLSGSDFLSVLTVFYFCYISMEINKGNFDNLLECEGLDTDKQNYD